MKYLAMTAATLMLLASPVSSFAQTDTTGGTAAGAADTTGSTTNAAGGDSQCNDETATSSYDSFSEKCRHQIDAWAASQSGTSMKVDGEIAVGTMVPDSVTIVDVPVYKNYGYAMVNEHRVLVDRNTHKIVRVY